MKKILTIVMAIFAAAGFVACSDENEKSVPADDAQNAVPAEQNAVPANNVPAKSAFPWKWFERIEPALDEAKRAKKLVFVEFTGSDWCQPCKILRGNVLASPEFIAFAKDKFVFVELDFPRTPAVAGTQSAETKAYNAAAAERFGVIGFPTVLILDAETAWPIAKIVGTGAGTAEYLANFAGTLVAGEAFAANLKIARAEENPELRAEKSHVALQTLDSELRPFFRFVEDEIIASDPADKFGLAKARAEQELARAQLTEFVEMLAPLNEKYSAAKNDAERYEINDAAMKISEQILARPDLSPLARQQFLFYIYATQATIAMKHPRDFDLLKKIYSEVAAFVPANRESRQAQENLALIERFLSAEE